MAKPTLDDLNPDEREALLEFARSHGTFWKSRLLAGWERAAFPGPLQVIRNRLGPSWLVRVRVKVDRKVKP